MITDNNKKARGMIRKCKGLIYVECLGHSGTYSVQITKTQALRLTLENDMENFIELTEIDGNLFFDSAC